MGKTCCVPQFGQQSHANFEESFASQEEIITRGIFVQ